MLGVWYDREKHRLTVILKGFRCSWDQCIFCCFSEEAAKNYGDLIETDLEILRQAGKILGQRKVRKLVLFNGGSFFELPYQIVLKLSELTTHHDLAVETRPEFLSEGAVLETLHLLKPSKLTLRVGLESASEKIRTHFRKGINAVQIRELINLRRKLRRRAGGRVMFIAYILFGVEGVTEPSVKRSVNFFRRYLDGVIAIKYRRYKADMPRETHPSPKLLEYLRINCEEVDMTESEPWEIPHREVAGIDHSFHS